LSYPEVIRGRVSSDLATSLRKPEPLRGYPEANRDRVSSVFHEPSSTEPLLGSPEAIRDTALLFGCPWASRYRAYFVMSRSQQGQSLFWDRAFLVGCTWAIRNRASWV